MKAWLVGLTSGSDTSRQGEQDGPELGQSRKETHWAPDPLCLYPLLISGPACFPGPPMMNWAKKVMERVGAEISKMVSDFKDAYLAPV